MKNKFRNPFDEKKPKKVGRLGQLSKSNRKAKNQAFSGLRSLESDWQSQKRWGQVDLTY